MNLPALLRERGETCRRGRSENSVCEIGSEQRMIWCRFKHAAGVSFGIVEGDIVRRVEGSPFHRYSETDEIFPLDSVKLDIPTIPNTFFCAGVNYADHIRKRSAVLGKSLPLPEKPDIGYRANSALIAHGENIVKPHDAGDEFQYEGELVAVFGRTAKRVSRDEALDCIFGWTIGNDISERSWQYSDRTMWRAKNSDTFKPMGPWIVTGLNPDEMKTRIILNGETIEEFDTGKMIFDVATYVSEVTKYVTIRPGDVMWMGTDGLPRNIGVGDRIAIEITGIGTLCNDVVAEPT